MEQSSRSTSSGRVLLLRPDLGLAPLVHRCFGWLPVLAVSSKEVSKGGVFLLEAGTDDLGGVACCFFFRNLRLLRSIAFLCG